MDQIPCGGQACSRALTQGVLREFERTAHPLALPRFDRTDVMQPNSATAVTPHVAQCAPSATAVCRALSTTSRASSDQMWRQWAKPVHVCDHAKVFSEVPIPAFSGQPRNLRLSLSIALQRVRWIRPLAVYGCYVVNGCQRSYQSASGWHLRAARGWRSDPDRARRTAHA